MTNISTYSSKCTFRNIYIYKYNKYKFRIINKTQLDYIGLTYTIFSINELTILFR